MKQNKLNEKEQIIQGGKQTEFWRMIEDHLNERINLLTEKILDDEELDQQEEKKYKYKLAVYRYLLSIPDILLKQYSSGEEGRPISIDPYD